MKGRILQRGNYLWIAYYHKGKEQREVARNVKTEEKIVAPPKDSPEREQAERLAEKFLKLRVDGITTENNNGPAFIGPKQVKVTVNEILDDLVEEYESGGDSGQKREVNPQMQSHLNRVRKYFGTMKAIKVNKKHINAFIASMKSEENGFKKNATINRSLQLLQQAYNLAVDQDEPKLPRALKIKALNEKGNVRKGKFTPSEAELIFSSLPSYMADVARFSYQTGTRSGELLKLQWDYLDGDSISVPGADTKNGKPRSILLTPELEAIISRRRKVRVEKCSLIFHHDGKAIVDYRKCWHTACIVNGLARLYCRDCRDDEGNYISVLDAKRICPRCHAHCKNPKYIGKFFHDFRRTAAHELWKAGGSEADCMEVTGHRTNAMFKRYADLFSKDEKLEKQRRAQEKRREYREAEATNLATMPVTTARQ
jgi:integrase